MQMTDWLTVLWADHMLCLIPVSLCLCDLGFGEQPSAWLCVDSTEWILLNFGGVIAGGIFIHQLKISFLYISPHLHNLFDSFWWSVGFCGVYTRISLYGPSVSSSHLPQLLVCREAFVPPFLQRTCRIHGSDSQLPSVQFSNQKCISKNWGWFQWCMSHPCFLLWAQTWGWIHDMLDFLSESQLKALCCRDCFSSSWVWQSPNKLISWGSHLTHVLCFPAKSRINYPSQSSLLAQADCCPLVSRLGWDSAMECAVLL